MNEGTCPVSCGPDRDHPMSDSLSLRDPKLDRQLRAIGARLRFLGALSFTTNALFVAAGLALLLVVVGRWAQWPHLAWWAMAPAAAGVLAGVLCFWMRHPSRFSAAMRADDELGLHERLSTMVFLETHRASDGNENENDIEIEIEFLQRADAKRHVADRSLESVASVRLPERARWLVLPVVAVLAVLIYPGAQRLARHGTLALASADGAGAAGDASNASNEKARLAAGELKRLAHTPDLPDLANDLQRDARNPSASSESIPAARARLKPQSLAELIQQVRDALASTKQTQTSVQQDAAASRPGGEPEQAADVSGTRTDAGPDDPRPRAPGHGSRNSREAAVLVLREAAVFSREYPEYADVVRRYFSLQSHLEP